MNPALQAARYLSSSPIRGAALGAGVGALRGAVAAPQEGETKGHAMLGHALRGAAVGGLAGGLARTYRDTRLLNPALSAARALPATAQRIGTSMANFGKRQIHGTTGHFDHDAIGMAGNATAAKRVDLLKRRFADETKGLSGGKLEAAAKAHQGDVKSTLTAGRNSQQLADAGVTSIPNAARALRDPKKRGLALRAMGKSVTSGAGGAAMAVGLPAALSAPSLLRGDESAQGGPSMRRKLVGLGAQVGIGAMVGGLPIVPQMIAGGVMDSASRRVVGKQERT